MTEVTEERLTQKADDKKGEFFSYLESVKNRTNIEETPAAPQPTPEMVEKMRAELTRSLQSTTDSTQSSASASLPTSLLSKSTDEENKEKKKEPVVDFKENSSE